MASFGMDDAVFLTAQDLAESPRLGEMTAKNGNLAFTMKKFTRDKKHSAVTDLYVYEAGGSVRQMTRMEVGGVGCPVFAPDVLGSSEAVMYLQGGQVRSLPLDGGESVQVTSFPVDVDSFKVFKGIRDTVLLACVMSVYPDKTPKETAEIDDFKSKNEQSSGMVFDSLMVRHWDTWNCYEKRNHVFLIALNVSSSGHFETGNNKLLDLMEGMSTDCPPKPFGGAEEYEPSPEGDIMALTCRRVDGSKAQPRDMAWSSEVSVFTVPIPDLKSEHANTAPGAAPPSSTPEAPVVQPLTMISENDNHATHTSPVFSPDGRFIAFLSMARATYESDRLEVILYDRANQTLSYPSRHIDLSFGSVRFDLAADDGVNSLFCTAQYRGTSRIYQLSIKDDGSFSSLSVMPGDETRSNPVVLTNRTGPRSLFFFECSLVSPNALKTAKLNGALFQFVDPALLHKEGITGEVPFVVSDTSKIRSLRDVYCPCPEYLNGDITMPQATQYYFAAEDENGNKTGDLVHMMYLPPVQLQTPADESCAADASFPLVLIIHGGPQGAITNSWNHRWNLSFHASRGYGVIAVNFHGSTSFGQAYVDSIKHDWGGQPFRDCLGGVKDILASKPYLDSNRVGALGASYGGFMINWINGHSKIFKCLVNHDGIFSLRNLYYSTEELWFPEWEFGLPWTKTEGKESEYDKWNPEAFVQNWTTPTLVIQGGKDHRVVETEGISTFTALQRKGIPSRLLFFPDENHWCLKTANSLKWHETVASWLDSWLK